MCPSCWYALNSSLLSADHFKEEQSPCPPCRARREAHMLERADAGFTTWFRSRQSDQIRIDDRRQPSQRSAIPSAPINEKPRDVTSLVRRRHMHELEGRSHISIVYRSPANTTRSIDQVKEGHPPICRMSESRFATPQCSVILPFCTRITSTVSK